MSAMQAPPRLADAGDGLASERLLLRRFTPADLPLLQRLNSSERVMRHLGGPMSAEQTAATLQDRILAYYDAHPRLGVWATLLRGSGECIGFHLLNDVRGEPLIQIGYRLFEVHWGRGYATEMSIALLRYGYGTLGLPLITAQALPENLASHRVLRKCGLRRKADRRFAHPVYARFGDLAHFERQRDEWLAEFAG